MKQKYCSILFILIALTQSLAAGGPSKRPGSLAGTIEALSYLMSGTAEWAELEGSGYSDDDDGDDTETTLEDEDPENLGDLIPIYLIGENRDNKTDLAFQALMMRLALEGKIILVHENKTVFIHNCIPVITLEPADLTIETSLLPLVQSCCTARSLLINEGSSDALLKSLAEVVLAIMGPNTPELINAISRLHNDESLKGNHIHNWIITNTATTLKHGTKKRSEVVKKQWSSTIQKRSHNTVNKLQQLLEALLLSLLQADSDILNVLSGSLELDFQSLNTWNDLIVADYLKKRYASAEGTPIVFIGDIPAIRRGIIESILYSQGIPTTNCIKHLSISEGIKEEKQNRIDEGNFETPVAVISLPKKFPVYLIGEHHTNEIDLMFKGLTETSEEKGLISYGRELPSFFRPSQSPIPSAHYLDHDLASTLQGICLLIYELTMINKMEQENLLENISTVLSSLVSSSDPLLLKAIDAVYQNEFLKDNWALKWIKNNKKKLLKKNDFDDRMNAIKKAFEKTIETKKASTIQAFIDGLRAIKMSILEVQKELPEGKQLTEEQRETLGQDIPPNDHNKILEMISLWRDIFITENIERLYIESEKRGIPLVIILGAAHIDNARCILESRSISTSSNVTELPLEIPDDYETSTTPAFIKFVKKEKQARLDEGIVKINKRDRKQREKYKDAEEFKALKEKLEILEIIEDIGRFNKLLDDI